MHDSNEAAHVRPRARPHAAWANRETLGATEPSTVMAQRAACDL